MARALPGQMSLFETWSPKGERRREYPPGSLTETAGCGRSDCFTCAVPGCGIRGEYRYCRYATIGNPYPCLMQETRGAEDHGCQFANTEAAYHRAGDHEPSPCCRECGRECGKRCGRAAGQAVIDMPDRKRESGGENDQM